jgi:hypothetical protein
MANYPIYRLVKGSQLTFQEMDNNLEWLSRTMSASKVEITGSTYIVGNLNVYGGVTASLFGTSSWATSASYAVNAISASYVSGSAAFITNLTSSNDALINGITVGRKTNITNTIVGANALITASFDNTAIGYQSSFSNQSGYRNAALGSLTLYGDTTGRENVAIGFRAGYANAGGVRNVYIGYSVAQYAAGTNNVIIGGEAGRNTPTNYSVILGWAAHYFAVGDYNTVLGTWSAFNTSGSYNTFLGCYNDGGGNNNTVVGARANIGGSNVHNNIVLSDGEGNIKYRWNGVQNTISGGLNVTGGPITGSNALFSGTITTNTLVVQIITSSITYSSGSNIFGNQLTNEQTFTGSVNVTGSLTVFGPLYATASHAISASYVSGSSAIIANLTSSNDASINRITVGRGNSVANFSNVAVGTDANVLLNSAASTNTSIGYGAGQSNISSSANTFLGWYAGNATTGGNNTLVGSGAGRLLTTGIGNIIIGRYTGVGSETNNYNTIIGNVNSSLNASNNIILADGEGNIRARYSGSWNLTGNVSASGFTGSSALVDGTITATTIVKSGGTSTQFLKADGTVDSSTYITAASIGDGTLSLGVSGVGLSGTQTFTANQSGNSTFTVTSNATSANTANAIVSRDGSGNFNAGTMYGTASQATALENTGSAGFVSNMSDTYTGTPKITSIISLSAAEYAAIGSPSTSTLYIVI